MFEKYERCKNVWVVNILFLIIYFNIITIMNLLLFSLMFPLYVFVILWNH